MDIAPVSAHRWRFFRLGGFDQVWLETEEDIRHLASLDQKLWAALSCPVHGLEFDPHTLAMFDTDGDGRVRVTEILSAVSWVSSMLTTMDSLLAGSSSLPLDAIDTSHPEGQGLLDSAKHILTYLGKQNAQTIGLDDLANIENFFLNSPFNGDGIITPLCAENAETRRLIEDIMACAGTVEDRSAEPGIGAEQIQGFFAAAHEYLAWWDTAQALAQTILPFGDATPELAALVRTIGPKIDDFFTRCALAAFDPKAVDALSPAQTAYESLALHNLASRGELEAFPLAQIKAEAALPLCSGINPAWAHAVERLRTQVIVPLLGDQTSLKYDQWLQIVTALTPFEDWWAAKPGVMVEPLGQDRVREILCGSGQTALEALLTQDLAQASQIDNFDNVSRLLHYNRDLMSLLNNFVSFRDFYGQERKAIFQAGTLYLDGRACELCIRVNNPDAHAELASLSRMYLAYCQCTRCGSSEQMTIVAALTGGDADNLMVGRNGIFYDNKGQDWDATLIKIIDHPISVAQAFWAPYKRIARMIGEQIEKFAAAKDQAVDAGAGAKLTEITAKTDAPAKTPFDVGKFAGIFAAIGLALGAIGTALASIVGGFLSLPLWQMPLTIGAVLMMVSGPSMLIAYIKLRQRTLGPILDAGGWAINSRASINIPFGATLTKMAELPEGAQRSLRDPFAEKKTPWKRWAIVLVLFVALGMAWDKGYIQKLATSLKPFFATTQTNSTVEQPAPPVALPAEPPAENASAAPEK
ncbi:hypothetical protein MASR1M90_09350 [Desulfovibrionales bacterium]